MLRLLPLLFILELALGIFLSHTVGFINTLLIYFVPTFLGLMFFSFQNQMIWHQFQRQLALGRTPDSELMHLVAKFIGAFLMIVPSVLCRIIAVLLLFPLTRFFAVMLGRVWVTQQVLRGSFKVFGGRQGFGAGNHNFRYYNFSHDFEEGVGIRQERDAKIIDIEALPQPTEKL